VWIRCARADEGERPRKIARRSKGYWSHDPERISEWVAGLDLSPDGLVRRSSTLRTPTERVVGWSALIQKGDVCSLDDLWIEPEWIGKRRRHANVPARCYAQLLRRRSFDSDVPARQC
jgi:hypothetical protein